MISELILLMVHEKFKTLFDYCNKRCNTDRNIFISTISIITTIHIGPVHPGTSPQSTPIYHRETLRGLLHLARLSPCELVVMSECGKSSCPTGLSPHKGIAKPPLQ